MESIDHMERKSLEALSRENINEEGRKRLKREIICGGISLVCLVVGMIFSYIFPSRDTVPALLYTIGFLVEGIPVFIAAVKGIFSKALTNAMEIFVSIAIIACYFSGQLILSVLIPLILNIAHILEERSIMGGRDVIEGLRKMQQTEAIVVDGDLEQITNVKDLKKGQHILVKPGAGIPIDGVIVRGDSHIDQKSLTGEPKPVSVSVGEKVYAGTVNIEGLIVVEVVKEYVDTSFSNILNLLEEAENISLPESRLIDRFMIYYIPFILAIAAGVALVTADISKAIAILVVSCPCGQMLVNSAPMIAALSAATKRGILVKNSKFIEELTQVDTIVFDKTGTLTEGNLSLTAIMPYSDLSQEECLEMANIVASGSNHPVSRAIVRACGKPGAETEISEISGKGMKGVNLAGEVILLGNRQWLVEEGIDMDKTKEETEVTVTYLVVKGNLIAGFTFDDTVRPRAEEVIAELHSMDVEKTVMLTGDREKAAGEVCKRVGIDILKAQLLPEDKLKFIKEFKEDGCVLAVGDGINDALALKEAHVGIAMGAMGSELAIQSADIALMNNNLDNIPFVIRLARKTKNTVYQNLVLSIGISMLMITLSATGVISAFAGTILHNLGAFAVLVNSSRILK